MELVIVGAVFVFWTWLYRFTRPRMEDGQLWATAVQILLWATGAFSTFYIIVAGVIFVMRGGTW